MKEDDVMGSIEVALENLVPEKDLFLFVVQLVFYSLLLRVRPR